VETSSARNIDHHWPLRVESNDAERCPSRLPRLEPLAALVQVGRDLRVARHAASQPFRYFHSPSLAVGDAIPTGKHPPEQPGERPSISEVPAVLL
jgi:hypothetical protein